MRTTYGPKNLRAIEHFYPAYAIGQGNRGTHVPDLYTEPGSSLHTPAEIGIDDFHASRSPTGKYRTTPLRGLWTHQKGGFYHDGRFQTLNEVVVHYNQHFKLQLTDQEQKELVEFLKSL